MLERESDLGEVAKTGRQGFDDYGGQYIYNPRRGRETIVSEVHHTEIKRCKVMLD